MLALLLALLGSSHTPPVFFTATELLQEGLLLARPKVSTLFLKNKYRTSVIEPLLQTTTDNRSQLGIRLLSWNQGLLSPGHQYLYPIQAAFSVEECAASFTENIENRWRGVKNRRYHCSLGGRIITYYNPLAPRGLGIQLAYSYTPQRLLLREERKELVGSVEVRTSWGVGTFNRSCGGDRLHFSDVLDTKSVDLNWAVHKSNLEVIVGYYFRKYENRPIQKPAKGVACTLRYTRGRVMYALHYTLDNFNKSQCSLRFKYLPEQRYGHHLNQSFKAFETHSAPIRFNATVVNCEKGYQDASDVAYKLLKKGLGCKHIRSMLQNREKWGDWGYLVEGCTCSNSFGVAKLKRKYSEKEEFLDHFAKRFPLLCQKDESIADTLGLGLDSQEIEQLQYYAKHVPSIAILNTFDDYNQKYPIELGNINQKILSVKTLEGIQRVVQYMRWLQYFRACAQRKETPVITSSDIMIKVYHKYDMLPDYFRTPMEHPLAVRFMGWDFGLNWGFTRPCIRRLYDFIDLPESGLFATELEDIVSQSSDDIDKTHGMLSRRPEYGFRKPGSTYSSTLAKNNKIIYKFMCLKKAALDVGLLQKGPALDNRALTFLDRRCSYALEKILATEKTGGEIGALLSQYSDKQRMTLLSFSQLQAKDRKYNNLCNRVRSLPYDIKEIIMTNLLNSRDSINRLCPNLHTLHDYLTKIQTKADYEEYMDIFNVLPDVNKLLFHLFS